MSSNEGSSSTDPTIVLDKEDSTFYKDADQYWKAVDATTDGMLGGLGFLSDIDIKNSERFLKTMFKV